MQATPPQNHICVASLALDVLIADTVSGRARIFFSQENSPVYHDCLTPFSRLVIGFALIRPPASSPSANFFQE